MALHDIRRDVRVRELRDDLVAKAAETVETIETIGCSSLLPVRRNWELHHEAFIKERLAWEDPSRTVDGHVFPLTVMMAIEAWLWQQDMFGSI